MYPKRIHLWGIVFLLLMLSSSLSGIGCFRIVSSKIADVHTDSETTNGWHVKTSMPSSRATGLFAIAQIGESIYCIGGGSGLGSGCAFNDVYDPVTDNWTSKMPMPFSCFGCAAGVVNGKIYVIGGQNSSYPSGTMRAVQEYDPLTNSWAIKASMPTPRYDFAIGVVGGKIYAIGGYQWGTGVELAVNEEYDPSTDSWTQKAPMLTPRDNLAIGVLENKIYAIGGGGGGGLVQPLNANEVYDPHYDSWSVRAPLPTPRYGLAASVADNRIYAIGGYELGQTLGTNEEYDPSCDVWRTQTPMPTARWAMRAVECNERIYVIGGFTAGTVETRANEEYTNFFEPDHCGFSFTNSDSAFFGAWCEQNTNTYLNNLVATIESNYPDLYRRCPPLQDVQLRNGFFSLISTVVRSAHDKGHCYGMAKAAKEYYLGSQALPSGVEEAYELNPPTNLSPYAQDLQKLIDDCQNSLGDPYLLARMVALDRGLVSENIEYDTVKSSVTIGVPVVLFLHQEGILQLIPHAVLAYGVDDSIKRIFIYDSNLPFPSNPTPYLDFEEVSGSLQMKEYSSGSDLTFDNMMVGEKPVFIDDAYNYILSFLDFVAFFVMCPVNLSIYDTLGRHTGINNTGGMDCQIPDSIYVGSGNLSKCVLIFNSSETKYTVKLAAAQNCNYTFVVSSLNQTGASSVALSSQILANHTDQFEANITSASTVKVTILGDVNGDKTVNVLDLILIATHLGTHPDSPQWNGNCDLNTDDIINVLDLIICATHLGQHWL